MASLLGNDMNILTNAASSLINITTIPLLLPLLYPKLLASLARQKNSPNTASSFKTEYDYIIVGAGAAGSVVAARLSEIPCVSVLLLEAGSPPPTINDVPGYSLFFMLSKYNWNYKTVPLSHTGRGLINNQASWASGKALGGGSILNNGIYLLGKKKDYDDWEAMGAKGWSFEDVYPYFIKQEDNRDHDFVENGYHGVDGPVTVMRPSYNPEIKDAIFNAAKEMGYSIIDANADRLTGFSDLQANVRDNQRCSTAKAYLVPAENRTNLDILAHARVKKVIIKNRRADGVKFSYKGKAHEVKANREVIMSAGTVNTAQLLMLSGIGPKEELEKHNIPMQADLPVGQNLQDHVGAMVNSVLSETITPYIIKIFNPVNVQRYIDNRTGPLCSTITCNTAFLYNDEVNPDKDEPNYELEMGELIVGPGANIKLEVYAQVYLKYQLSATMFCLSVVSQPLSRGNVTLRSANPYNEPLIDPNYLADPKDMDAMVEGMKTCKRIANSHAMRKVEAQPFDTLYPGCEKYANDDDLYFRCQARSVVFAACHPCGTAKMGDPEDPSTVVDPELRVKNIQGLRVVDTSIMPKIVSGNNIAAAIMIGEKASDIIKETIQC